MISAGSGKLGGFHWSSTCVTEDRASRNSRNKTLMSGETGVGTFGLFEDVAVRCAFASSCAMEWGSRG
jgi:hypothetical protein